ncbi:MAG: hypothetical protein KKG67_08190 [Gammaproteobacteria bacterium]|nr:hypothetical protein [Gammaproteobacteria bacterium]
MHPVQETGAALTRVTHDKDLAAAAAKRSQEMGGGGINGRIHLPFSQHC